MRAVLTRVRSASVTIDGHVNGSIGRGFLILLGVGPNDTERECRYLAEKALGLRVFEDENGKMNRSLSDVGGESELLMEEIRCECARELFGEFQRKFDLVRWGIWYDRTTQYNSGSYLKNNIRPCHRYLPIPSDQIAKSGYALDNKEYEE